MNIINYIREKQNELIYMINSTFDELVKEVENFKLEGNNYELDYEITYPITNTKGFKGRKPIAVEINGNRTIAPTWKRVVEIILKEAIKDEKMKLKMLALRDVLLGRVRTRVSKISKDMRSPLKIDDGLYIETHYDTETLIKLLLEILEDISYDYNNIKVIIKNK